jgi:hypothetical protein
MGGKSQSRKTTSKKMNESSDRCKGNPMGQKGEAFKATIFEKE